MNHKRVSIVLDLDGTLYFGGRAAEEAPDALEMLQKGGFDLFYLTNNSVKTRSEVHQKLQSLGFPAEKKQVYNSAYATARYLVDAGIQKVYCIGTPGMNEELRQAGVLPVDHAECEAVVLGLSTTFGYTEIAKALEAVTRYGARIVAANVDRNFPVENGRLRPGANVVVSSLLGTLPDNTAYQIVGKPETYMLKIICEDHGLDDRNVLLVGDSEESDGMAAKRFGIPFFLVGEQGMTIEHAKQIMEIYR